METQATHLLMADLVDYSRTMESDRDHAISMIHELREEYLEPVAARMGGSLLKRMGDGWIFEFPSESNAVEAAVGVQRGLADHVSIRLRVACHSGELLRDDLDFYGPSVNLAQRIMTEAPPGGVMVSQELFRQLPLKLSDGFRDAGSFRLKNIAAPVTLYQWRPTETGGQRLDEVPGIAVEPFGFAPENADTRAAAEDLRQQLMARLSHRTGIRVLDDGTGQARNATYLLRGRLRIAGTRARLSLTMVLSADSQTVWSQNYEGDPSDILAFCDSVIEKADVDLRLQINAFDGDRVAHLPADRLSLSELRSRAASAFYRATIDGWEEAQQLLERAERLSPDDPMTASMQTEAMVTLAISRHEDLPPDVAQKLERRGNNAVSQSPRSDHALWARGLFRLHVLRDLKGARADLERTLTITPSYVPGLEMIGKVDIAEGRFADAVKAFKQAVMLSQNDPLLPVRLYLLAVSYYCQGSYEEAAGVLDQAMALRPEVEAFGILRAVALRGNEGGSDARAAGPARMLRPSIAVPRLVLPPSFAWLNDAVSPKEAG